MSSNRRKSIRRPHIKHGVVALAVLAIGTSAAAAQSAPGDYAGKQIRMVIAAGAGGGYDTYARFLARHLHKHIAGSSSVISQNMPGAAGMTATNWAYSVAPKDGTVILATYNSLLPEPLYANPAARFDPRRFEAVGSISRQQNICATWHTSPIKTIAQARTRELTVAATGATGDSATLPKILNAVAGTRFKVISGYGTTEQRLAVERGEVDGVCGLSWSTLKASTPDWIQNNRLNVLVQTGASRQADLPMVPVLNELLTDSEDRRMIEFVSFAQEIGRPFLMPPETPKELVTVIRRAFDATLKDPAFLTEAEKAMLEVDPVTGEQMNDLIRRAYATPQAVVRKAMALIGATAH